MPRTADPDMIIEYTKSDGSILRARLEERQEGTFALDLRPLGRGRPTLKPPGSSVGTKELAVAKQLARQELIAIGEGQATGTPAALAGPLTQAGEYLKVRISGGYLSEDTAARAFTAISRCWTILHEVTGATRWSAIRRDQIAPLTTELTNRTFGGVHLSTNTRLNHLNYLKGLYRYLVDTNVVTVSPIHGHSAVPRRDKSFVRKWLEPWEMGLLLETSFGLRAKGYQHNACAAWPEILATECYTGAREDEVLGLTVADLRLGPFGDHSAGTLEIRPNSWRGLKNPDSARVFSLWPAHAKILMAYVRRENPPKDGLLFPGPDGQMWVKLDWSMARDMKAAGIKKTITDHSMRHSYITARARQYKEVARRGKIVLVPMHYTDIQLEVGHNSAAMRDVYEHASHHPVEGWTTLDYRAALAEYRKGLGQDSAAASALARRSKARRSASGSTRLVGPQKARSRTRNR